MKDEKPKLKKIKRIDERVYLSVPSWWKEAAVEVAHSQGIGLSEYLRQCVENDLAARGILAGKIKKVA